MCKASFAKLRSRDVQSGIARNRVVIVKLSFITRSCRIIEAHNSDRKFHRSFVVYILAQRGTAREKLLISL